MASQVCECVFSIYLLYLYFFSSLEITINGQQTAPVTHAAGPFGVCVTYEKCNH